MPRITDPAQLVQGAEVIFDTAALTIELVVGAGSDVDNGGVTLKAYEFYYGRELREFNEVVNSGGAIVDDVTSSQIKLVTDTTANSSAKLTSYLYFPYTPQHSNTAVFSIACGDIGKTNVIRRWGLYDDDGLYFELSGTVLSVNIKSSITNTITSVTQDEFNTNALTSEVFDIYELDVSKYNFYWISYQWQGIGVVKFGGYSPNGERIVLHAFENANINVTPYMKRGTLPIRLEQFNTGIAASISEIKSSCINVERDSEKLQYVGNLQTVEVSPVIITNTLTPIVSLNVKPTINGLPNKSIIQPIELDFFNENEAIIIEVLVANTLTGDNFISYSKFTNLDVSATATSTDGIVMERFIVGVGEFKKSFPDSLIYTIVNREYVIGNKITIAAKTIKTGVSSTLHLVGKWREII